jgi:glycosyltransferase involved in cell wall biosynthesis
VTAELPSAGGTIAVCVSALFVRSKGIARIARTVLEQLADLHPELAVTLLVHPDVSPELLALGDRVQVRVLGPRNLLLRLLRYHLLLPLNMRRYALHHSVGNMGMVFCPIPQCITIHDVYEKVSPERFSTAKRWLMGCIVSLSGRNARRIIADSESTARDIAAHYPHLARKTTVVYPGASLGVRMPPAGERGQDFLSVGTVEPGKDLPTALRAFAVYARERQGMLRVVGKRDARRDGLDTLVGSLGIADRVTFLGTIRDEELDAEYSKARALVLSSRYEGFGLPVVEAMSYGCPVIAARNSAIVEAGGESALYFETGNADDLAEKMRLLADSPEMCRELARRGREHSRRFDWREAAERTYEIYQSVADPS